MEIDNYACIAGAIDDTSLGGLPYLYLASSSIYGRACLLPNVRKQIIGPAKPACRLG